MNAPNSRGKIAVNNYFTENDFHDLAFAPGRIDPRDQGLRAFKDYFSRRGIEVHTVDMVDFQDSSLDYVIYFDLSWRYFKSDPFIHHIPREKLVLVMLEPPNVNPSLYYVPYYRRHFSVVFTWNTALIARNSSYVRINVPAGVDINRYQENPFPDIPFSRKKLLVAINRNRWAYMPQSTYGLRIRTFEHFERKCPDDFDLYGEGWNQPRVFYERWFGYRKFKNYRGAFQYVFEAKIPILARYKFCLCFENNASEPGYISEKIIDAFCARCVPIYYGWEKADEFIPKECFINFRDFRNCGQLTRFLRQVDEFQYRQYIAAIEKFLNSPEAQFFTNEHLYSVLFERLYLRRPFAESKEGNA